MANWENRIVSSGMENPDQLLANPFNFRLHPKHQQKALDGVLNEIGWIQDVIVNETTGHIVDGHLRVSLALKKNQKVPVKYVRLSEDEERIALASIDPISALANQDEVLLDKLIGDIETVEDDNLSDFLRGLLSADEDVKPKTETVSLTKQFIVPPFSVLDAKQGYWRERKAGWLDIGIESELGRGNEDDKSKNGLTYSVSSQPPEVYDKKAAIEEREGVKFTWSEFAEKYPDIIKTNGTSIFDPVLCEIMYSWFCPKGGEILDPFSGGSVRGIVAGKLGYNYTGVDLRSEQIEANRQQGDDILGNSDGSVNWVCGDSIDISDLAAGSYDFLFSCPPYADLEVYSDDERDLSTMDYEDFVKAYKEIIKKSCDMLKNDSFAAFVVGEVRSKKGGYYGFVQDTITAFTEAGCDYYNEAILLTMIGSAPMRAGATFRSGRKLCKGHQNILVFCKGDWKKATEKIGEVLCADLDALILDSQGLDS